MNWHAWISLSLAMVLALMTSGAWAGQPVLTLYLAEGDGYIINDPANPGAATEIVLEAAKSAGIEVQTRIVPWKRAVETTANDPNAIIPMLSRLPSREDRFTWIGEMLEIKGVFTSRDHIVNSYEEAKKLKLIGVWNGTSYHEDLLERGFKNVRAFFDVDKSVKMIESGRVAGWFGSLDEFYLRWNKLAENPAKMPNFGTPVIIERVWLSGGKGMNPDVVAKLRTGLQKVIGSGRRDALVNKYFQAAQ